MGQGYNVIKFPSFRDSGGINYALLENFNFSEWLIPDVNQPFILNNTFAIYEVEAGSKAGCTMPKRAMCSKISANKIGSGFCGSNFMVSETYLQPW